jgi:exodeoxyribonuclease-3
MKLISWNVNGLRACLTKGFEDFFNNVDADIFCVQETKMQEDQAQFDLPGYDKYWNSAAKKGYSGTAVFTRLKPLSVTYGLNIEEHDQEGRIITLEFENFFLVNVYTPNSKRELLRLDYRMKWEDDFRIYIEQLDKEKPLIVCGDINVAHEEIDIKNPKSNRRNAGFTDEERGKMTTLLQAGFTDSFRYLYPDKTDAYTWWSYMMNARARNIGWRIDYFLLSDRLRESVKDATIHCDVMGSDHCPIGLELV